MGGIGMPELLIVVGVIVLLFGGSKLPKLARSIGQASTEFKKGVKQGADDDAPASAAPKSDAAAGDAE